jgi:DNA-binding MarR family transcriptional regulator
MDHLHAARRMTADCLCFRARRAARAITRLYDEALRPLGLQAPQLTLMNAIAMAGAEGQPMRRLADALALDLTTLSRNLRTLEAAGLVAIGRSKDDRRVRVVSLTGEGERLLVEALPLWSQAHAAVVERLGAEEARTLRTSFDRATQATHGRDLARTAGDAAPGPGTRSR